MTISFNEEKLQELIVTQAVDKFVELAFAEALDKMRYSLEQEIKVKMQAEIQKAIATRLDVIMTDTFNTVITPVNSFGQQTGEPKTISKILEDAAKNYWSEQVDPRTGEKSTNSYGSKFTRAEYIMVQTLGKNWSEQLKPVLVDLAAATKDGIRLELRNTVDQILGELFKVKTVIDKEEKRYV